MAKRNLIEELEAQQDTRSGWSGHMGASGELTMLGRHLGRPAEASRAICQLVPIRVVACIEGCLKSATAELINHGDPFRSNARKIFQQIKMDFDVVRALLEDRVSLGEFVANSVGWHDVNECAARMTAILGFDFLDRLRTIEDRWAAEIEKKPRRPIIDDLGAVLSSIGDALKLRHVLCHEIALAQAVEESDANRMLAAGIAFTDAASWVVAETLHPGAPLTQTDMNIAAGRGFTEADEKLGIEVTKLLEKLDDEDKGLLRASQDAWIVYRKSFSELEGNAAKGGTLRPTLYASAAAAVTEQRILELQESIRHEGLGGRTRRRRRPR